MDSKLYQVNLDNDVIYMHRCPDCFSISSDNQIYYDLGLDFKLDLYINRLGYNLGYDVLFDYGSILRMAYEKRKTIMKEINLE